MTDTTFTDGDGRAWTIRFDYDAVVRMRAVGFDLRGAPAHLQEEFARIGDDPITMIDVVAAAVYPQLAAAGVPLADFKRSLYGEPLDAASTAFLRAVGEFFPKLRPLIDAALTRIAPMLDETVAELTKAVTAGAMDADLRNAWSEPSGSAPASAASTPAASASAS